MNMQQSLMSKRPQDGLHDGWIWEGTTFTVRGAYKKIRGEQFEVDQSIAQRCRAVWKQKVPLKVGIHGWQLVYGRLPTRVFRKRLYPDTSSLCAMCSNGEEDCQHLFFECPVAKAVWSSQTVSTINTSSDTTFWESFKQGRSVSQAEGRRILAVLWAIWLHRNDAIFKGRAVSIEGIIQDVAGLVTYWSSRP